MNKNYSYGLECEYSLVDSHGNPQVELDGKDTFNMFMQELKKPVYKDHVHYGAFVPEVLSHMVETNTNPGTLAEVSSYAQSLHQIVEEVSKRLGLVISEEQPAYPQNEYYSPKPCNPQALQSQSFDATLIHSYFKDRIDKFEDYQQGLGYMAGTTAIHMHFSTGDNEKNFKLRGALAKSLSQEMRDNPASRYQRYGMSDDRFNARSKLVEVRQKIIGDVVGRLDEALSINGNYREFIMDRFFKSNGIIIDPKSVDYNMVPNKDHRGFSIKQPANSIYTVESRLADGPCNDIAKIPKTIELINDNLMRTLEGIDKKMQ